MIKAHNQWRPGTDGTGRQGCQMGLPAIIQRGDGWVGLTLLCNSAVTFPLSGGVTLIITGRDQQHSPQHQETKNRQTPTWHNTLPWQNG